MRKRRLSRAEKKKARMLHGGERPILCPPDRAARSLTLRLIGFLCRLAVTAFAVMGLSSYILTAFYPKLSLTPVVVTALVATLIISLMYEHAVAPLLGGLFGVGTLAVWLLSRGGDVVAHLRYALLTGYNTALDRLHARGFYSMVLYRVEGGDGPAELLGDVAVLVTLVVALLFVPFFARRVRIAVPTVVSVLCLFPLFLYNVPATNTAITLLIAGFTGTLIMAAHDVMYGRGERERGYEGGTLLFADDRPPMPEGSQDKQALRLERLAARKAAKEARREAQLSPALQTVKDELTDYFSAPAKTRTKKSKRVAVSPEAKDAAKQRRAQIARVRAHDRITAQARAAMGGIAGASVMLVALLLLIIPSATVSGPFNTIESIDRRVEAYREYVTAKLRGDDPVLDLYAYLESIEDAEPHSTTAVTQTFRDIRLMHVGSQYDSYLYMPNFVGTDYADGAWQYFSDEQYYAWRDLYDVEDAPSESIYIDFFELMAPTLIRETTDWIDGFSAHRDYGFSAYMVNVIRMRAFGSDVLLPRVWNSDVGLLEYASLERLELPFANVFDGVASGHLFDVRGLRYSAIAYVPIQTNQQWIDNVAAMIASYCAARDEIERYEESRSKYHFDPDYSLIDPRFENLAKRYIEDSTTSQRKALASRLSAIDDYTEFVYQTYLDTSDSEAVRAFAERVIAENGIDAQIAAERDSWGAGVYTERHRLTMALINTLVLEKTYTRTITEEADETLDGVDNFLEVMDQDYCVQYASAVTLALRELGIPARYVEGYLANDYQYNMGSTGLDRYTAYVHDRDAHAWVEVWYDGVGWIVYEATPEYYVEMYGRSSAIGNQLAQEGSSSDSSDENDTPTEPPVEILPTDPTEEPDAGIITPDTGLDMEAILRMVAIALAVLVPVAAVIWLIARTAVLARRAERARQTLAHRIAQGDEAVYADQAHRTDAARTLIRETFALLSLYGLPPEKGELKDAYARRLSFALEGVFGYPAEYGDQGDGAVSHEVVSRVHVVSLLESMAAQEFGGSMTEREMRTLAEWYLKLREAAPKFVPTHRRIYWHYIKRRL